MPGHASVAIVFCVVAVCVCGVRREFDKRGDQIWIRRFRWHSAQNLRWSPAQVRELLAHEITAISFFESETHFDFPSAPL